MARPSLSPAEHDLVTAAVTEAEIATDGEIVTIVTERSDAYHDVALHCALAAMLLVAGLAAIRPQWLVAATAVADRGWTSEPRIGALLFTLMIVEAAVFLLVRLIFAWMPLRLALTPKATKSRRVRRRAVQYFKVGAERRTQAQVGILLFLSLDEHAAEIVADEAIHGRVTSDTWGEAMAALVDEAREGRAAAGMAAAVARIGTVLSAHFPKSVDNPNELPDRLIEL